MALSEHEQRIFEQIEQGLTDVGWKLDKRNPVIRWRESKQRQLKAMSNEWQTAPSWMRRMGVFTTALAFGSTVALGILLAANLKTISGRNHDRLALRAAVTTALQNSRILAITGTCSLELGARATEVDAMPRSTNSRDKRYDGPTGDELRQAANLADIADIACTPVDDGAYTMQVNGSVATLQESDVLWTNPDVR